MQTSIQRDRCPAMFSPLSPLQRLPRGMEKVRKSTFLVLLLSLLPILLHVATAHIVKAT